MSGSHRAVILYGQTQPVRDQQDSGFFVHILQLGFQLQEVQLEIFQIQLLQLKPMQGTIGPSGQSVIMWQFWTLPVQTLSQLEPVQGGNVGLFGSIWFPVLFQKL